MWRTRLLKACLLTLLMGANVTATREVQAQANFDRPGGDYASSPVPSGDPADCALVCERDRCCRAWSFNYPTDAAGGAVAQSKQGEVDKLVLIASEGGDSPRRLTVEKLFVVCREDKNSEGLRLPKITAAYDAAPGPKKLKILEGEAHAQFIFETDQGPRLMDELLDFLSTLGESPAPRPVPRR